jgi:hypothetical protein
MKIMGGVFNKSYSNFTFNMVFLILTQDSKKSAYEKQPNKVETKKPGFNYLAFYIS